ncbi:unnamed protein product [Rotaria sp. Silwood2]|nr:unnamed protein product [Rotaria sp. Silwood2]CAF4425780.1 unnamed protein product [Rotaria sp. Silwood2]
MKVRNTTTNTQTSFTTTTAQSTVVQKRSPVWIYFEKILIDGQLKAKCLIHGCEKILAIPLHSTSTLIRHLGCVHKLNGLESKEKLVNRSPIKKISLQLKKKLDDAVIEAIIQDGRSFGDFSKAGFKKFLQLAVPNYITPYRSTISKKLKRLHAKHFVSMIDSLTKLSSISISTDFWSDSKGISYLVLTGHFTSDQFDINSTVLRFSTFQKRHFSEIIGVEIENQLIELKILDKVISITCDAAPNMVKISSIAFDSMQWTRSLDRKKEKKNTTDEPNLIELDERLSHSLKKIDIFDIEESFIDEGSSENNSEGIELQAEDEEDDVNDQQHDDLDRYEGEENFSDDDDDLSSIDSEYDSENAYEVYEDNFQVGVDVNLNQDSDEELPQLDSRIGLVIYS